MSVFKKVTKRIFGWFPDYFLEHQEKEKMCFTQSLQMSGKEKEKNHSAHAFNKSVSKKSAGLFFAPVTINRTI
jgi:hypothetical protein